MTQPQKDLTFCQTNPEVAKLRGYPTWNTCNHHTVDMSHLDHHTDDYMSTISIKLPNGLYATVCIMQHADRQVCLDVAMHGENLQQHHVDPMGDGRDGLPYDKAQPNYNRNIYAVIADAKEVRK